MDDVLSSMDDKICPKLTSEGFNQGGAGDEKSVTLVHQPRPWYYAFIEKWSP
jgi:hypothetical protein